MAAPTMYLSAVLLLLVFATKVFSERREETLETSVHKKELCGGFCTFRICRPNLNNNLRSIGQKMALEVPGVAGYTNICRPSRTVGRVLKTGEPLIKNGPGSYYPLYLWGPSGLSPKFARRFFTPGRVPLKAYRTTRTSIVRGMPAGNQWDYLDGQCIVLPVHRWQEIDPVTKAVVGIKKSFLATRKTDCVSFQTVAPKMRIQVTWLNDADVDMIVTEPNGDVLGRASPKTKYGSFFQDAGVGECGLREFSREKAVYRAQYQPGPYGVQLVMGKKCNTNRFFKFRWIVRVMLDGREVFNQSGWTNAERFETITTLSVTI